MGNIHKSQLIFQWNREAGARAGPFSAGNIWKKAVDAEFRDPTTRGYVLCILAVVQPTGSSQ